MDAGDETLTSVTIEAGMSRAHLEQDLERLHTAAFGWAVACCEGDRGAAEDALQATYLKILDGRARFEGRSSFKTWVFGVVRLTATEERRRGKGWRWGPLELVRSTPDRHQSDVEVLRSDESAQLQAALATLSERQREVLHLVFYQDLTIAEAAEVAGLELGTARTHYARGKAAMKRILETTR